MSAEFLNKMRVKTQQGVERVRASIGRLRELATDARRPHRFADVFRHKSALSARIIAEIKFASPALGIISSLTDPVSVASQYVENGAAAISILTETEFFKGNIVYLEHVRLAFPNVMLLMKDFIIHECQLLQARISGADAVLLIVALLSDTELTMLYTLALDLGLTPLLEVHTINELHKAEALGGEIIGINNRDLHSLKINLDTSHRIIEHATSNAVFISESGIQSGRDIFELQPLGYDGFLIGGKLMSRQSPGKALKQMLQEVTNAR